MLAGRKKNWWQANALRVANEIRRHEYTPAGLEIQYKRFVDEECKRSAALQKLRSKRFGRSTTDVKMLELETAVEAHPSASKSMIEADMALQRLAALERERTDLAPHEQQANAACDRKMVAEKLTYCNAIKDVRSVRNALRHPERTPSALQRLRTVTGIFSSIAVAKAASRRRSKSEMLSDELEGPLTEFDHYTAKKPQYQVALFAGALLARTRRAGIKVTPKRGVGAT